MKSLLKIATSQISKFFLLNLRKIRQSLHNAKMRIHNVYVLLVGNFMCQHVSTLSHRFGQH